MMTANGTRPASGDVWPLAPVASMQESGTDDPALASSYAVLGSAIQSAAAAHEALALLAPHHFADTSCQVVFEAVAKLADAGQPVEPASVLAVLAAAGTLARVNGANMGTGGVFLAGLLERSGNIGYHALVIRGDWQRRSLELELRTCITLARSPAFDPEQHLDEIRRRVEDVTAFTGPSELRPNSEAVYEVLNALEDGREPGLTTGYTDLDLALGGLRCGTLTVIGARPGHGKSLLGLCIADHVGTRLGLPVLFSSLEMTEAELTERRISATARVPLSNIVRHQLSDGDWDRLRRAQDRLAETSLFIDDTSPASPSQIRGRLQAMIRSGKPARLSVIDYLGFMTAPRSESRQQAVAELARQCKNIARDFAIPVILLAQLNRGPEVRSEKRPMPADLRESGEIEQSADIVILLHREDVYEPESPRAGEIDLVIPKNRQGSPATVTLCFQGYYGRIVSMAREDRDPDGDWSPSKSAE